MAHKDVLTTSEVARICSVATRTVSKWFDSGKLGGYKIPGSKDRRIPLNRLIHFMKQHSIPLNGLMSGRTRLLIIDNESDVADVLKHVLEKEARYDVEAASDGFGSGIIAGKFHPHVILLDMHLAGLDAQAVCAQIKKHDDLLLTKVIAMSSKLTDTEAGSLTKIGFDGFLRKPFNVQQIMEAVEDAMNIIH